MKEPIRFDGPSARGFAPRFGRAFAIAEFVAAAALAVSTLAVAAVLSLST